MASIERRIISQRMAQAVVYDKTIYLAGQVAVKSVGKSVAEQAEEILLEIERLLLEVGSTKEHLLSATIWLTDMSAYDEFNSVWDSWLVNGRPPARACVEVTRLADTGYKVEVSAIAAIARAL